MRRVGVFMVLGLFLSASCEAVMGQNDPADWPQFRGPNRDGICSETGLLREWPKDGPKLLWKINGLGKGYSSVAIAGGKLFTMGDRADAGQAKAQRSWPSTWQPARKLWATRIGPPHKDGPRCTPTVDGPRLYAIGTEGDLVCLETATGQVRWRKNFAKDFGGKMMSGWKFSESPLVDAQRSVCTPGGKQATMVALDKQTGEVIWKCAVPDLGPRGRDGAAYASMVVAEIAGVRQYVQLLGRGVVGVEAKTGRFLWGYNAVANNIANIPTPVVRGDYVFCSTAYDTGSALLKIVRNGDRFRPRRCTSLGRRSSRIITAAWSWSETASTADTARTAGNPPAWTLPRDGFVGRLSPLREAQPPCCTPTAFCCCATRRGPSSWPRPIRRPFA